LINFLDDQDDEHDDSDDLHASMHGFDPTKSDNGYEPYGSKMLFLLDWLNNMPQHWISGSLMKVILFVLHEGGAKNVPSFSHLQKTQVTIR
jgi:hypothetical protein